MYCRLVVLDNSPGVRPAGIGETLRRDLAKLVMRASEDQAKTASGNIQMCAGLKSGIEGATHVVWQWRLERSRARRNVELERISDKEAKTECVEAGINNLRKETLGTEEEEAKGLNEMLELEIERG